MIAVNAWFDAGTPIELGWALAILFCFMMAGWFLLLLVVPGARKADSRWQAPVSDAAGGRILGAALGALFVLMTLIFIVQEAIAFEKAPWLGVAGAIAFVAGLVVAHRFVRRGVRHHLMPYTISATCVGLMFATVMEMAVPLKFSP
mgnify:CR=1 FL=1